MAESPRGWEWGGGVVVRLNAREEIYVWVIGKIKKEILKICSKLVKLQDKVTVFTRCT